MPPHMPGTPVTVAPPLQLEVDVAGDVITCGAHTPALVTVTTATVVAKQGAEKVIAIE